MELRIYRDRSVVATVSIDENTVLTQRFFGESSIRSELVSRSPLSLAIGDYIVYDGVKYVINQLPNVTKNSTNDFVYSVTFESEYYDLSKVQFMLNGEGEFDYIANLEGYIDLLVSNLNRVYGAGAWIRGLCTQTDQEYKTFHFAQENCRQVVQRLCRDFSGEMCFYGKEIRFSDVVGSDTGLTFEYRAGLRGIVRQTENDKNIVTRLYAFGSSRNLGTSYRSGKQRLMLPVQKNLLANSGFETGDFTGWDEWGSPETRSVIGWPRSGTYGYFHESTTENAGSEQQIACRPSTKYTLSAWVFPLANTALRLVTYDGTTYTVASPVHLNGWERISQTITTGAAQTSLSVWIGGIGSCYFDDVQIERGDVLSDYSPDADAAYLERNVASYGIVEHTEFFEDIYPHRTGTISSVDGSNSAIFYDTGMDFDVNSYLVAGLTAKVRFLTGQLAGYEFEVSSYVHASTKFTIIPAKFDKGLDTLPSATLKPAAGDTYVLLDISLPASYITTAEEALEAAAKAYIDDNSSPRVKYNLKPDPRHFKTNRIVLKVGDKVTIQDSDLGVNKLIRVTELSYPLIRPWEYEITVSDFATGNTFQRLYAEQNEIQNKVIVGRIGDPARAKANWRTVEELKNMVFDPDGYFTDAIRPSSIETLSLDVGAKSMNFALVGIDLKPNVGGDRTKFYATAGALHHFTLDESSVLVWTMAANSYTGLTDGTAYYIYARCHKTDYTSVNNQIVLDATARKADSDATYYYFLVGVLHAVSGTVRAVSLTYGHTFINGKHITTGKISSADGNTYFDLDNNTLVIGSNQGYGFSNFSDMPNRLKNTVEASFTGLNINDSYLGYFVSGVQKVYIASNGDMKLGDPSTGKGMFWDQSEATLTIRGTLNADDITAGTITGRTLQTAAADQRVVVSGVDNTLKFYRTGEASAVIEMNDDIVGSQPGIKIKDSTNGGALYIYQSSAKYMFYEHYRILGASSINNAMIDVNAAYNGHSGVISSAFTGSGTGILYIGKDKDSNTVFTVDHGGYINAAGAYKIDGTQVVGNRVVDSRADDTINTSSWDSTTAGVLDAVRDCLIAHGLLAAS